MIETSYRTSHVGSEKAASYNDDYGTGFLGQFWRSVERPALDSLFSEVFPDGMRDLDHLDVACGTGRILAFVSEKTKSSTGVDISEDMLAFAKQNAPLATVNVADVTALGRDESYDLVTAFRFFLNAEEQLRSDALDEIVAALRPGGILVTNIHASPSSIIGVYRRVSRAMGRAADETMRHDDFADFLEGRDLEVVASRTYGYVPLSTKISSRVSDHVCDLDTKLSGLLPERSALASNWLVAVRKPA